MIYEQKTPNTACTRSPEKSGGATLAPYVVCLANHAGVVVGLQLRCVRTLFGQSGSLRGLKRIPSKRHFLVPPTIAPQGHNATVGC
jgi:hypothetical protein